MDLTTNAGKIKVPVGGGGVYLVSATLWFVAGTYGARTALVYVNGTYRATGGVAAGPDSRPTPTVMLNLAAGDVVSLGVYVFGGTDITIKSTSEADISLALAKL
jgi:hypothetical protein